MLLRQKGIAILRKPLSETEVIIRGEEMTILVLLSKWK